MDTAYTFLFLASLLLLAIAVQPVARRIHLPFTATLVITGYLASELVIAAGFDTGIRADNFHDLIFFVFLPVLIFESAFNTDVHLLVRNLVPILFLAIPLMLLSTLITAALVYAGIAHPTGFPWIAALLTGALLSATDPIAVVALFRQLGVSERLVVLMEGESLFNDATAIVVFGILLSLASDTAESVTIGSVTVHFLKVFFGGVLVGGLLGLVMLVILRRLEKSIIKALLTVISAYLAFIVAESMLHVSGVVAVLITGLVLGNKLNVDEHRKPNFTQELWEFNAYVANALVFLLMGVTITFLMFEERWLAMLIGIVSVILARSFGILMFVPLLSKLTPMEPIERPFQVVMIWGGLRGAVTLALALSLPTTLEYWWTIQSIAFGVVLFTLFVQATSTAPLLRHYKLDSH